MNEIDVVVDVRPSPDSAELIVSKQKLAFSGEAHLVGSPVESRVGLLARKAKIQVFAFAELGYGYVVAVRIKNVGTVPFGITRVVFEYKYKEVQEVRFGSTQAQEVGGSIDLAPRVQDTLRPAQPGEEREYFLPQEFYDGIALQVLGLPADRYWFAVYSGTEQIGRLGGEWIRPFFDRVNIVFHRRAIPIFDTLPEKDRLAVVQAVAPLRTISQEQWPSAGAEPIDGEPNTFVIRASNELGVVVTLTDDNKIQVTDIVRESLLEQIGQPAEGVK